MNRYMESIVKGLGKYGGDIIKFVGDAMIVVWPRDEDNPEDSLTSIARKAIKVSELAACCFIPHSAQWISKLN